eukprot:TRINITY_DN1382_c1_g1_i2.p1 TRINITY_DN1382_c1_g1~~TRINITY_DN1382_c1_g1_i2.p1  ORF type:complete len:100 (+),score=57.26 TRINITY_DN1382_c1_g1_i2:81-380(+)
MNEMSRTQQQHLEMIQHQIRRSTAAGSSPAGTPQMGPMMGMPRQQQQPQQQQQGFLPNTPPPQMQQPSPAMKPQPQPTLASISPALSDLERLIRQQPRQ